MEHTQIVSAAELEQYAERIDSEAVIPELISLLIKESVSDLTECRIPYGDKVNEPGWDGLVETPTGFRQFVPSNGSFWEIGTGKKPQGKATSDFKKRTRSMSPADRQSSSYVFLTPRCTGSGGWSEPQQSKWKKRRGQFGWHRINILDGHRLSDWLREFPALGRWLQKKMGNLKSNAGLATPAEHWESLQTLAVAGNASLFHKIFLLGRTRACEELQRLFRGEIQQLLLATESQNDAEDFVAAFLESLDEQDRKVFGNQCLFVKDADAWLSFAQLKSSHVLLANPKIDLESDEQLILAARKNHHRIIIPVSGKWSQGNDNLIQLRSPSRNMLETGLLECGFESAKAKELAGVGALNLSALKRFLLGLGERPPYATWPNARILAQAGLIGKWQGDNPADVEAMATLLGKPYGEWIDAARELTLCQDTPLSQRNEKWKMISRDEAWSALSPRLNDDDLDRFQSTALLVLGELDPKFDLPPDEHYLADVKGKALSYSTNLRDGLAESLALLGSRPTTLVSCTSNKAERVAYTVVRGLLMGASWKTWASLHSDLPLLAEAAPDAFLDAVENALVTPSDSPFLGVFAQESTAIGGWNYTSGLLWALESLAWSPDYLARVTLILGDLASIDPGGNWANRASNSLNHIFLPWFPQTTASVALRGSAVRAMLGEQPTVGWKTLLGLLPTAHGTSSGSHKPSWRQFIPADWNETVTTKEYWDQVSIYAELAVDTAATDIAKLAALIDRLPDLPQPAHARVLAHLQSEAVLELDEEARLPIWESLVDLSKRHRKFADTAWAMPLDVVSKIEEVADKLTPRSTTLLYARMFTERDFDLYDENQNFEEQIRRLNCKRQDIVSEILKNGLLTEVIKFAERVESPRKVGFALGSTDSETADSVLLPDFLEQTDGVLKAFCDGFVWGRYLCKNWTWIDAQLGKTWSSAQIVAFLALLPFDPETWRRAEKLLIGEGQKYWESASVNPWGLDGDALIEAAGKLIKYQRADEAIGCLYVLTQKKIIFPAEMASTALMNALHMAKVSNSLNQHYIQELIKWLQNNMPAQSNDRFQVEWAYLSLLDRRLGGAHPKTLEYWLATNPSFFCEVIAAVFRSDKEEAKLEPTEKERGIAQTAYRLLNGWASIPGINADGSFDEDVFKKWLSEVKEIAIRTGHLRIAMDQLGQKLWASPPDSSGLWIHRTIAEALDAKDGSAMRSGFAVGLFNTRGVFSPSGGAEEKQLAAAYRTKSDSLSDHNFHRLAATVREVANDYELRAKREAETDRYDY